MIVTQTKRTRKNFILILFLHRTQSSTINYSLQHHYDTIISTFYFLVLFFFESSSSSTTNVLIRGGFPNMGPNMVPLIRALI